MQVQNINSSNYKNHYSPNFGVLKVSGRVEKLTKGFEKELADTKYFDLEIGELSSKLWMFILKKEQNPKYHSCEAPLYVFKEPKDNKLDVFGTDICDCQDNVWYPLEFATKEDAQAAFKTLNTYKNREKALGDLPPFEQVHWAVDSVKFLEKAFKYMENPKVETVVDETPKVTEIASPSEAKAKLPFTQRLKNAWLALKGD